MVKTVVFNGLRLVVGVVVFPALLGAPQALAANQVTGVTASGGSVQIAASSPPNFTTFTMSNPPRLVVDIADGVFQGVPSDIAAHDGDVVGIKAMKSGSGATAVARVIITYGKEIDTDIVTNGNSIVVRPSASQGPAEPMPSKPSTSSDLVAATPPPVSAPSGSETPSTPDSPPPPQAPPPENNDTVAAPQEKSSEPPVVAQADSPTPQSSKPADEPAPSKPAKKKKAAEAPPPKQTTVAQNDQPPPSSEPPPAANEAPPAKTEPAAEAPPPAAPANPPSAEHTKEADQASPPPPPPSSEPPQISSRRKTLALVGLRFNGSPSVFIKTNEPAGYQVSERGDSLIITVQNTRIARKNDTRPLDVHFFDSPISVVRAHQAGRNVEIEIQLKSHAPYQATQSGDEVQLSFSRG